MDKKQERYFCKKMAERLRWYEAFLNGFEIPKVDCPACCIFSKKKAPKKPKCSKCPIYPCENVLVAKALSEILDYNDEIDKTVIRTNYYWYIKKLEENDYEYDFY